MKGFYVKLPDKDAEKFKKLCAQLNKSCYEILRELIYKLLEDHKLVTKPKYDQEIEELRKRIEALEKRLEKIEKSSLTFYMTRKK